MEAEHLDLVHVDAVGEVELVVDGEVGCWCHFDPILGDPRWCGGLRDRCGRLRDR